MKRTAVVPVKLVPVRVTDVPISPLAGAKLVMVGAAVLRTVKVVGAELTKPAGVFTEIAPVTAPAGTVAVICVALATVKVAVLPPRVTPVAPVKLLPLMVTVAPCAPLAGVKLEIAGGNTTAKLAVDVTPPIEFTTPMGPDAAPAGT